MNDLPILGTTPAGEPVYIDLNALRVPILIQASSGGGKSFLLRRLLEQTHGKVLQFFLDREGDGYTLREKFRYVLVAAATAPKPERPAAAPPERPSKIPAGLLPKHVAILVACAKLASLGHTRASRKHVAALADRSPDSSTFDGDVALLTREGYLAAAHGGVTLTMRGAKAAGGVEKIVGRDLVEAYRGILDPYQCSLFDVLVDKPNRVFTREELGAQAGKSTASSTFDANLAGLTALGLAEYPERGKVQLGKAIREVLT